MKKLKAVNPEILEGQAVGDRSQRVYRSMMDAFEGFCEQLQLCLGSDEKVDKAVIEYFDHFFEKHEGIDMGTKTLVALGHFRPRFRPGRSGFLARARRALQGWNRLAPATALLMRQPTVRRQ